MKVSDFLKVGQHVWELPGSQAGGARAPVRVLASAEMLAGMTEDGTLAWAAGLTSFAGVMGSVCMVPTAGSVVATDAHHGAISPGAVGFDINLGARLLGSQVRYEEAAGCLPAFLSAVSREVSAGGRKAGGRVISRGDLNRILEQGAEAFAGSGFATEEDIERCELGGRMDGAAAGAVPDEARSCGRYQLGTLGDGLIEVQEVCEVFDRGRAGALGLFGGQLVIMIFAGSRDLGRKTAESWAEAISRKAPSYGFSTPGGELTAVPFQTREGQAYFAAMAAAANFGWANRQHITWIIRNIWERALTGWGAARHDVSREIELVCDSAHNLARREVHFLNGEMREALVHRRGAARAFPGEAVLVSGLPESDSYVLFGEEPSLKFSLGSVSGRAGEAARVAEEAGLASRVARLRPVGLIR